MTASLKKSLRHGTRARSKLDDRADTGGIDGARHHPGQEAPGGRNRARQHWVLDPRSYEARLIGDAIFERWLFAIPTMRTRQFTRQSSSSSASIPRRPCPLSLGRSRNDLASRRARAVAKLPTISSSSRKRHSFYAFGPSNSPLPGGWAGEERARRLPRDPVPHRRSPVRESVASEWCRRASSSPSPERTGPRPAFRP